MAKRHNVEQGSAAWYALRLGIPTSSNFHRIITPTGKPSEQARKYMYRLIAERLLRDTADDEIGFVKWVAHGKESEPNAVASFQFLHNVQLEPGGFWTTDDGRLGASPDRVVAKGYESVEIKCPAPWTQIGYIIDGPGADYRPQVQGHLLVGGFQAAHFYSWHARTPPFHRLTLPDIAYQAILRELLEQFNYELDKATDIARDAGAYAAVVRTDTPAEAAYGDPGDAPLQIIVPGNEP